MLAKKPIAGGVRAKPHVRMLSQRTIMYGMVISIVALALVFMVDPFAWFAGAAPKAEIRESVDGRNIKMDLDVLPSDYSNTQKPASVNVASTGAPTGPLGNPDVSDLPNPSGIPAGFPPTENKLISDEESGQKKGPVTKRLALGFSGSDDPFDSISAKMETKEQNNNAQMVSMMNDEEENEERGQSRADKFRSQNRGSSSMYLANGPESAKPRKGYGRITPGFQIPAKLMTATSSELGGAVVAKVSQNIYDEATGTCLMIDMKNSKIFGKLSDDVTYGQNRQQAVWKSIHTPEIDLDIGGMDATDGSGRTGIPSEVNRHYGRLAVAALGATALDVLGDLATSGRNAGTEINIGSSAANNVASIGQQIVQRELQVKDTLEQIIGKPVSLMVDRIIELPCLNRS